MNDATALLACGLLIGGLGCITLALVWLARDHHKRVSLLSTQDEQIFKQMREYDQKFFAINVDLEALATRNNVQRYKQKGQA